MSWCSEDAARASRAHGCPSCYGKGAVRRVGRGSTPSRERGFKDGEGIPPSSDAPCLRSCTHHYTPVSPALSIVVDHVVRQLGDPDIRLPGNIRNPALELGEV